MKNNYLLIDYGNSYIKAAIYDADEDRIVELEQAEKGTDARTLFSKFHMLGDRHPEKIIEVVTAVSQFASPFNQELTGLLKQPIHIVSKNDFVDIIDFSNVEEHMFIGSDILSVAAYIIRNIQEGAAFVFGSVYVGLYVKDKQLRGAYFLPSIMKGMRFAAEWSLITADYLPHVFDKQIGLNTTDAFAAGGNLSIEGFVDKVIEYCKVNPKNVLISGGDCEKFTNISKKYTVKQNLVILGMIELIKARKL